jgi:hypothetical protein
MSETASKLGRKEILTEELARKIAKMIERFPDNAIPVTWENVMTHCKKRFGKGFTRQMLSQKEWNGVKIIGAAFGIAKSVQARLHKDTAPKYSTAARPLLQKAIGDKDAKIMALQEELEKVRADQVNALNTFLNTQLDLRKLLNEALDTEGKAK